MKLKLKLIIYENYFMILLLIFLMILRIIYRIMNFGEIKIKKFLIHEVIHTYQNLNNKFNTQNKIVKP